MRSYFKEMLRDFSRAKGRFFAIVAIVALGAGFFGGLKATSVDMKLTADEYYKESNMMDFRLLSTLGLTTEDAAAIKDLEEIEEAVPSYRVDVVLGKQEDLQGETAFESIVRLHAILEQGGINKLTLDEGRFPTANNECVIVNSKRIDFDYAVGDKLVVDKENDPDGADSLKELEFEVVGIASTPLYMSIESSSTNKGSGSVKTFGFILEDAFDMEAYTELYVTMKGSSTAYSYGEEYASLRDATEKALEDIGPERLDARYDEVVFEANEKLAEAEAEYNEKEADAKKQLADGRIKLDEAKAEILKGEQDIRDAKKKLADSEQQLIDGEVELEDAKREYDETVADAKQQIADAKLELADGEVELAKANGELNSAKAQLAAGRAEYLAGKAQYDAQAAEARSGIAQLEGGIAQLEALLAIAPQEEKAAIRAQISGLRGQISGINSQLSGAAAQLSVAKKDLDKGSAAYLEGEDEWKKAKQKILDGSAELSEKELEFEEKTADAKVQIDDAQAEIEQGKVKLEEGKAEVLKGERDLADGKKKLAEANAEYTDKEVEANEKLADGKRKLRDAKQEIADLEYPEWYVLDRNDAPGHSSFEQDANRIDAVSIVFPIFFFLVAALVSLTTMTRMVEEQRSQAGTYSAMGYSKGSIAFKYMLYAVITSVLGSVAGLLIGFQVFPKVIWDAYGIMYSAPPILTPWNHQLAMIAMGLFVFCIVVSTLIAVVGELRSTPASLIRPKPPQNGKRIILERIGFIWKGMSFAQKLTARNILRYKKRFFMTVIGIAGCTGLMLTGFGIKDSISGIVPSQYGRLFKYHAQLGFAHKIDKSKLTQAQEEALEAIASKSGIKKSLLLYSQSMSVYGQGAKKDRKLDVQLMVPEDGSKISEYITFQKRKTEIPLEYPTSGAIVNEKLAKELSLEIGDSFTLQDIDNKEFSIPVTGICENYISNYVYISPQYYKLLYGEEVKYQSMLIFLNEEGMQNETAVSTRLLEHSEIGGIFFTGSLKNTFENSFASLDMVVVVLIISASMLAFVVLYNLTNINVTERIREIATIKVLGFTNHEVDSYIYRENIVLTIVGILAGFVAGIGLHQFVMESAEINLVMFSRDIYVMSYVWSALLTVLFALIVNIVMHGRLKRVNMVESLKSVE